MPISYVSANRYASTGRLSPAKMLGSYIIMASSLPVYTNERTETKKHGIDESTLVLLDINAKNITTTMSGNMKI